MRITLSQWSIVSRRGFSTSPKGSQKKVIELAYTRHEPADTPAESRPPIIVMHGLFGSQRNNRTFSKYGRPSSSKDEVDTNTCAFTEC